MKKLLLSLLLVLPLCSFAQKGMQGIGVNCGGGACYYDYGGCSLGEFSLKYQNNITNYIRISPHLKFNFSDGVSWHEDEDGLDNDYNGCYLGCDLHLFFTKVERSRVYGIVGGSIGGAENYYDGEYYNFLNWGVNLGIGIDYRIDYHISLQGEFLPLCAYYDYGCSGVFCLGLIGLTYTF